MLLGLYGFVMVLFGSIGMSNFVSIAYEHFKEDTDFETAATASQRTATIANDRCPFCGLPTSALTYHIEKRCKKKPRITHVKGFKPGERND
jgi:hypothetical protein